MTIDDALEILWNAGFQRIFCHADTRLYKQIDAETFAKPCFTHLYSSIMLLHGTGVSYRGKRLV